MFDNVAPKRDLSNMVVNSPGADRLRKVFAMITNRLSGYNLSGRVDTSTRNQRTRWCQSTKYALPFIFKSFGKVLLQVMEVDILV